MRTCTSLDREAKKIKVDVTSIKIPHLLELENLDPLQKLMIKGDKINPNAEPPASIALQ